ncbi:hypothetical protein BN14_08037 [Rhizoctonia solani AG-1 IB]|uniref:Uncharacterized protein n=1 Tax=Thanatephorus cucumeris (strain AG1-IB / isolate 7/3/14) TaxID=1108050 RepID=M5C1U8_THACB|nr:hypothetical protein BN14_08037 [Rhizoctonia solani AG-1 IB]
MDIIEDDGLETPEIPDLSEILQGSSAPPPQPSPTLPTPCASGKWATPSTGKWAVRAASEPVGGPKNPLINSLENALSRIPPVATLAGVPASSHLSQWSLRIGFYLEALFSPLSQLKPDSLGSTNNETGLNSLRLTLLDKINTLDALTEQAKMSTPRPCPEACNATSVPPPPPPKSYAHVAAQAVPTSAPAPQASPKPKAPTARKPPSSRNTPGPMLPPPASAGLPPKPSCPVPGPRSGQAPVAAPVRLVIRFGGKAPQELRSVSQPDLFRRISSMLDVHPTHTGVTILGAHWNKSGNVIVSFPPGTPKATLLGLCPDIGLALGLPDSVVMSVDKCWTKLLVSSVPARLLAQAPVFTEADVAISLNCNPVLRDINQPRPV